MNGGQRSGSRNQRFASANTSGPSLQGDEQSLIREFVQALAEEIEAIKKGKGGSIITVYDGLFVRREGPFFVYKFTTESPLVVMEDADAKVKVGDIECNGQIISVHGSEVAVAIERDFGPTIPEAKLSTDRSALLEALRKRFAEVLSGQRSLDTRLRADATIFIAQHSRQNLRGVR
jgi:hypothetical protein